MAKDIEKIPVIDDGSLQPTEPQGFAFNLMVRCDDCLRANPPTRVNCLYCGTTLPLTEASETFQKPALRKLEKWEQGFNNILRPVANDELDENLVSKAAALLRLEIDELRRILKAERPLPLARAATLDEASLIERKLAEIGLESVVVSDALLALGTAPPQRIRAFGVSEAQLVGYHLASGGVTCVAWSDISFVSVGRLFERQIEIRERKSKRAEKELVDAREITKDEAVLDVYVEGYAGSWRILANSFDFSCLEDRKKLLVVENFSTLVSLIRERAPQAIFDDSYLALRQALDNVWPAERSTEARGWRRDRPGKYSTGEVVISSNEAQFTRYSRLSLYLKLLDGRPR